MQLLTASKLSTVTMLAMAAVLHFSVNAVPMEQPGVKVASVVRAPSLSDYRSWNGKPSEQAIKDMLAIYALEEPQATDDDQSPVPDNAKTLFDTLPMETLVNIVDHMDVNSRGNLAQTGPRNYEAVQDRSPRFVNALVTGLDELWDAYKKENTAKGLDERKHKQLFAVSPVWEKVVKQVTGTELKDCPYNELPYTPDGRPEGKVPSEETLLELAEDDDDDYDNKFHAYVRHNICRLAVNGAYPWLLRIIAIDEYYSRNEVFSVLGQLRLFASVKTTADDLNKALKLFASISRFHDRKVSIPSDLRPLLMLSLPEINAVMALSLNDITRVILLLLAAEQQRSGTIAHMKVGKNNLADIAKVDNMSEFLNKIKPSLIDRYPFLGYPSYLVNQLVGFDQSMGKTVRQAINDLLNSPSSGFASDGMAIKSNDQLKKVESNLSAFGLLGNLLPEDQLIELYDDTLGPAKNPVYIITVGMSKGKPGLIKHVFENVFGAEGTPISGDLRFDDSIVVVSDLAFLAQGCAIVYTDQNWQVFVEMFVKKIRSTSKLPGGFYNRSSYSTTPAQRVAEQITLRIKEIESVIEKARKETPEDKNPAIQAQVDKVTEKLQVLATALTAPLDVSPPVEGTPAKSQPSQ